ncbi:MAG: hypothetical protein R6U98_36500 [Pirellulaceae bacterium]
MSLHRNNERTVQVYSSSNRLEVEAIAEEVRAAGITCSIDGGVASTFPGFTALDGVALISLVVFESDTAKSREIAARWLSKQPSDEAPDEA